MRKNKEKLDYLGVSAFAESMAMMLQSGVSAGEALLLLKQDDKSGILSAALEQMALEVDEGSALSASMAQTDVLPEYFVEMVRVGEKTGRLEEVMSQLADYYQTQDEITEKLKSAVVYPLSMLIMIIIVLVIMLSMVLPAFNSVYENLSASSIGYMKFAHVLCSVMLAVMSLLAVAMGVGVVLWNNGKREAVEKVIRKIPVVNSILDEMAKLRFTSAYNTYISSGEMQEDAVIKSMKLVDSKPVEATLKKCLDHMEEGHSFGYAANKEGLYEAIYGRMLLPGEKSGSVDRVLRRLVSLLKEDIGNMVARFINTVEPLLSGILMISIGLVLISLMLPLIGMMNSIG